MPRYSRRQALAPRERISGSRFMNLRQKPPGHLGRGNGRGLSGTDAPADRWLHAKRNPDLPAGETLAVELMPQESGEFGSLCLVAHVPRPPHRRIGGPDVNP
ncbi:hypothetical protein MPLB_660025 [Mesorhizobium sp. ORS 3324]|nr:hypothetical protein MPLB_660025 [Mesorhizobium sp. ORS 3324]